MNPTIHPEQVIYESPMYDPVLREYVVGRGIAYDDFLRLFDGQRTEWVLGTVIKDMTNNAKHQLLLLILSQLFGEFLDRRQGGQVWLAGLSMYVGEHFPAREPDLLILLPTNTAIVEESRLNGVADIVVEIVSPESTDRDYNTKFAEYAAIGVPEYWLIDPIQRHAIVYCLTHGVFEENPKDSKGRLQSRVLPSFAIQPSILWQNSYLSPREIRHLVDRMLV